MNKKKKVYWRTKKGDKIDVDLMDIDHLRNIVKMVVRQQEKKRDFYNDLSHDYLAEDWGDKD